MTFLRAGTSLIGLDVGNRVIKAAQFKRTRKGLTHFASAILPRGADDTAADSAARIADVLERQEFAGTRLVVAAPVRKLECEMLDLPPRGSGAPLEQIAHAEVARSARLEAGRYEMGCWDVPPTARSSGSAVLAMALRHGDADAIVEPLELHGLEVVAIDAPTCALHRACRELLPRDVSLGILDLGWDAATLQISTVDVVFYQRTLWDLGTSQIVKSIVAQQELPQDAAELLLWPQNSGMSGARPPVWLPPLLRRFGERVCAELKASFSFARQRFPDRVGNQLLLTGGGSVMPLLCEMLGTATGMETTRATPADPAADCGKWGNPALLALARGLALYGEEL